MGYLVVDFNGHRVRVGKRHIHEAAKKTIEDDLARLSTSMGLVSESSSETAVTTVPLRYFTRTPDNAIAKVKAAIDQITVSVATTIVSEATMPRRPNRLKSALRTLDQAIFPPGTAGSL